MGRHISMGLTSRYSIATAIMITLLLFRWCLYYVGGEDFHIIPTASTLPDHSKVNTEPAAKETIPNEEQNSTHTSSVPDKVIVMAKLQREDTEWVTNELPEYFAFKFRCIVSTNNLLVGSMQSMSLTNPLHLMRCQGTKVKKLWHT